MATTASLMRIRFPEFSDKTEFPDERINVFLEDAIALHIGTDEARWGGKYDLAHSYISAHLLFGGSKTEARDFSAAAGPIASKSVGGVSVTRAVVAKDNSALDSFYSSTAYGQVFISIRSICFVGVLTAAL